MVGRPGQRGRSGIASHILATGLALSIGYTFGVFTLGGCASAPWPSNGQLPEPVVDKLTECAKKGPTALKPVEYAFKFAVHVDEEGEEARIDDVLPIESTLDLPEVKKCMRDALYGMRTPLDAVALRRRTLAPGKTIGPEGRALLAQAQVALLFEATAVVVAGFAVYTVVTTFLVTKAHTKHRPRPVPPETEAPREPDKDSKPEAPPEGDPKTTGPTPPLPPPPPDCPRNEKFSPTHTDNATGCTDKTGKIRCYANKHHPCAGVHTHGKLSYQEIRNGICKSVERKAVRCDGSFKVSGPCGSTPTVECKGSGSEISGIHEE